MRRSWSRPAVMGESGLISAKPVSSRSRTNRYSSLTSRAELRVGVVGVPRDRVVRPPQAQRRQHAGEPAAVGLGGRRLPVEHPHRPARRRLRQPRGLRDDPGPLVQLDRVRVVEDEDRPAGLDVRQEVPRLLLLQRRRGDGEQHVVLLRVDRPVGADGFDAVLQFQLVHDRPVVAAGHQVRVGAQHADGQPVPAGDGADRPGQLVLRQRPRPHERHDDLVARPGHHQPR